MKIGIIGYGVVGKAAEITFSKKYQVIKYDKYANYDSFSDLLDSKFIFIMVPTPFDCSTNETDDSAVLESLQRLVDMNYSNTVVIKSTLPPGSCDSYISKFNLNIAFNPEFLRESTTPNEDFAKQHTVVIGTNHIDFFENIKSMYSEVLNSDAKYIHTTLAESEMIKCAQNTMLASRVALANMIFDACSKNSIDYQKIREVAFDPFDIIGPYMTQVPGPDGSRGFGGKCLPKDIRAFSTIYKSKLLEEIISYNDSLRKDLANFLKNYKD